MEAYKSSFTVISEETGSTHFWSEENAWCSGDSGQLPIESYSNWLFWAVEMRRVNIAVSNECLRDTIRKLWWYWPNKCLLVWLYAYLIWSQNVSWSNPERSWPTLSDDKWIVDFCLPVVVELTQHKDEEGGKQGFEQTSLWDNFESSRRI